MNEEQVQEEKQYVYDSDNNDLDDLRADIETQEIMHLVFSDDSDED